nr:MAG TPA: hypothetical protein [Caudoviricetes sp.]
MEVVCNISIKTRSASLLFAFCGFMGRCLCHALCHCAMRCAIF